MNLVVSFAIADHCQCNSYRCETEFHFGQKDGVKYSYLPNQLIKKLSAGKKRLRINSHLERKLFSSISAVQKN